MLCAHVLLNSVLHSNFSAALSSYTACFCNAAGTVTSGCHTADTARQSGAATQELENGAWQLGKLCIAHAYFSISLEQ
jgi:hypothetical protein